MLSCSKGWKSRSSSLPGSGVLMWASGSSPLPQELELGLRVWHMATSASALRSGMKRATRKATTTVHAPSRKGGPGIMLLCGGEEHQTRT